MTMIAMLRADLIRLSTLRSSYALPVIVFALVAGITAGALSEAGSTGLTTASQLREPLTASAGIMVAVAAALFAAMRVAGEYRYGTIGQRLLAVPRRHRVLAEMLLLHGLWALVIGAVALAIGTAIAQPMLAAKSLDMAMTPAIGASALLAVVSFALIGACCGLILRSQPAAVLVIVGTFVVEKLLGMFIGGAAAYLPYAALNPLLRLEGATIGAGAAAMALATITVALVAAAAVLFIRRDITP